MTAATDDGIFTAPVEALDADGAGLITADALRVHVAGALPGETVSARIVHRSPHRRPDGTGDAWADLIDIVAPSVDRATPACPAHGRCGGCVLQHLDVPAQRRWKRETVQTALGSLAGLAEVAACVPSPRDLGYRNQAKYVVARDDRGALALGAYAPRSHSFVDLAGCRLIEPPLDETAAAARRLLDATGLVPYDERTRTGLLRYFVVRSNGRGEVLATLITARDELPGGEAWAAALRNEVPAVVGVMHNVNATPGNALFGSHETLLSGSPTIGESWGGVEVALGSRAFAQLNREVASLAYAAIREAVAVDLSNGHRARRLLDVYGGAGPIAFSVADLADEIAVIDDNAGAIAAGAQAASRSGLGHVRFVAGRAADVINEVGDASVVVLNPPRGGLEAGVVSAVAPLRPRLVAYLTCNPTTHARDQAGLTQDGSLAVDTIRPFDMLPHTSHVETLVILRG